MGSRAAGAAARGAGIGDRVARVTAAVFASYAFAWGVASCGARAGVAGGLAPTESVTLSALVALLLIPGAVIWVFATARPGAGWLVLGGAGALLTGLSALIGWLAPGGLP